jgi:hypothetical protein
MNSETLLRVFGRLASALSHKFLQPVGPFEKLAAVLSVIGIVHEESLSAFVINPFHNGSFNELEALRINNDLKLILGGHNVIGRRVIESNPVLKATAAFP